jgi:hypothetical protein
MGYAELFNAPYAGFVAAISQGDVGRVRPFDERPLGRRRLRGHQGRG